jgi:glycosyltransferase involved in cell wall biosynthesis
MKVAIIIPTMNEGATISKFVRSLNKDPYPNKEIIIVDGGSVDNTVSIARENGVTVLEERGRHKCPANARNQGVKKTDAELICFLDGDTDHVNRGFITNAVKNFEDPAVIGVRVEEKVIDDTLVEKVLTSIDRFQATRIFEQKISKKYRPFTFLRKEIFKELGGFPLLGFGEDKIVWQKLGEFLQNNPSKKIVFEPKSKFFKHRHHSFREFFKGMVWYGRTIIPYLTKAKLNIGYKLLHLSAPLIYVISMISIPLIVISPWFFVPAFPYILKIFLLILESVRRRDKYCLLIPLTDLIYGLGFTKGLLLYLVGKKSLSRE